ncbi:MAG TPA: hypothetical protein VFX45_11755 [Solirubrobacterales bacterium]|nr:hypothetical protein [Solirubrobacterales bacterium]
MGGAPPVVGYALIALVVFDPPGVSHTIDEPAIAAAALLTAAILIVGSAFVYCKWPNAFLDFAELFTGHKKDER